MLCIGANTALVTAVDSVVVRPLPFPQVDRLAEVAVAIGAGGHEVEGSQSSGLAYQVLQAHASTLLCAAISDSAAGVNVVAGGVPEFAQRQRISAGLFAVLGVQPLYGREFSAAGEQDGAAAVILSHSMWRRDFAGDPAVLGRSIQVGGAPHTVVGVMPPGLQSWLPADLWTPLRPDRDEGSYQLVARLRPAVRWRRAEAEVQSLAGAALADLPRSGGPLSLRLIPLQEGLTQGIRLPLLVVAAAGGVVLLIGCLNLAGLMLARQGRRRREIATRLALGGGRAIVVREVMSESALLAVAGGIAGLAAGSLGLWYLRQLASNSAYGVLARHLVGLDGRTLAGTGCLSLLTVVLFAWVPALRLSATDPRLALHAVTGDTGTAKRWPRQLLIATEVALAVMLVVATGLLIRSMAYQLRRVAGFDPTHLLVVRASLADARYESGPRRNRLFTASLEGIRRVPGVQAAAVSLGLPYERSMRLVFSRLGGPDRAGDGAGQRITGVVYITPDYFSTLRIPLLRGRAFDARDRDGAATVAIVNHAFASRYYPDQTVVGRRIKMAGVRREIVGVVGDVLQRLDINPYGPLVTAPTAYIPATQLSEGLARIVHMGFSPAWVVRTAGPWKAAVQGVERAVAAADSALPLHSFQSMEGVRASSLGAQRFQTILLASFAGLALLLTAIGLYGLIAQSVVERTRELGIRMALGATVVRAVQAVALPGIGLTLAGAAAGLAAARAASQLLMHMLFGITGGDPLTYAGAAVLLAGVGICATVIPALRVAKLDPVAPLRSD